MEPFDLKLQQVTFEEDELPAVDLDSFSNVIHYDSALLDSSTGRAKHQPVASRPLSSAYSHKVKVTADSTLTQNSLVSDMSLTSDLAQNIRQMVKDIYSEQEIPFTPLVNPKTIPSWIAIDSQPQQSESCQTDHNVTKRPSHAVAQPSRVKVTQVYNQPIWSRNPSKECPVTHFLGNPAYGPSSNHTSVTQCDIQTLLQISSNTTAARVQLARGQHNVFAMAEQDHPATPDLSGGQPFESVADALHLQQSVIGNKHLAPAPPDVVAQIIAETERKLKSGISPSPASQTGGVPSVTADTNTPPSQVPVYDTRQTSLENSSILQPTAASVPPPVNQAAVAPPPVNQPGVAPPTTGTSASTLPIVSQKSSLPPLPQTVHSQLPHADTLVHKELIRIPSENITRTKEKKTWFGGGQKLQGDSGQKETDVESLGDSAISSMHSQTGSGRDLTKPGVDSDSVVDDNMSVASSSSELESFGDRDTDSFLKSLKPFKTVSLKDIVPESKVEMRHSPPVKETSFRPVFNAKKNVHDNTSNSAPVVIQSSLTKPVMSPVTGVMPPLTEVTSPTTGAILHSNYMMPNAASYVIPKPGPLFQSTPRQLISSQRVSQLSQPHDFSSSTAQNREQLDEILREKAKLEGQLEMLSMEAQATLQERAELQAQVASLKLKLMSHKGPEQDAEKDILRADLEALRQLRLSLEQSLGELQRQLDERVEEGRSLQEELMQSQETGDKLQMRMKEVRDDMKSKDMTIQALKNKVAELYVEVQTSLQTKMESDNSARSARSDLAALQSTKQWYQEQLETATKVRSELQRELTILQAQAVSQGSIIERLKTENTKLRHQLSEIQQKALKEKELLAHHLEAIETDMMDREAAFQEIQRERSFLEDTFNTKIQTAEDEKNRISLLMQMTTDLETQLDKARGDLKKKQNQIFGLESEQINLMKQLAVSQETVMEKERLIEELKQSLIEVDTRLRAFQSSLVTKDAEILRLKEEKAAAEIALKSAQQEKKSVDIVLDSLKSDMGKVEKSFKQMKQEISSKSAEINQVQALGASSQEELDVLRKQLGDERRSREITAQEFQNKTEQLSALQSQKIAMESELLLLREKTGSMETSHEQAMKEKQTLEEKLVATQEKLTEVEVKLQDAAVEVEKSQQLSALDSSQSAEYKQLEEENQRIKDRLVIVEKDSKKDVMKQKARAVKLNNDLKAVQSELTDRQTTFDTNMELMSSKLRELAAEKEKLETELNMAHRKYELSMVEQQDQIAQELQNLASELEQVRLQKQQLEAQLTELHHSKELEVQQYQQQLSALEEALRGLQEEQQETQIAAETNQTLNLELEKERGRLTGVLQSNTTLKQHVSQLEEALARRESSLVDLQTHLEEAMRTKEHESADYIRRVQTLEESLQKEKESQRDVRKQTGMKITENKKLRRQNDSLKQEHEQLCQDLEQRTQEVGVLQAELDTSKQTLLSQQAELKAIETENKSVNSKLGRVKQMLADNMAKEPVIQEQIQGLQWQLSLKSQEVEAAQEQMRLAEQRQLAEIDTIRQAVEEKNSEIEMLRNELSVVKHEKQLQQAKMTELRSALKSSIQHHKMANKVNRLSIMNGGSDADNAQLPPLPFDLEDMEQLLQDTSVRALESKPLDNLQNCLSNLRAEISGLQLQMEAHTTTVETSTNNWSSLEKQVEEIRHVVQTISNTTMTTASTTSIAAAAVEAADRSSQIMDI